MSYTIHDTPTIRQKVEADLRLVQETVTRADPHLKSIILTGGFARGEGGFLDGRPQNDYDFVIVRDRGRARVGYARIANELERRLGLHIDLACISPWRLRRVKPTIFWYETALRGRVIAGSDLLDRIPVRTVGQLDPSEGLRLLANRAAGLLLITASSDPHELRIQAAKALLAVLDANMLARGVFPPTQTERWNAFRRLQQSGESIGTLPGREDWITWAYRFKVDPAHTPFRDGREAWRAAARAIVDTVPVGLAHAGLPDLHAYARRDGLLDHVVYLVRARNVEGARRLVLNPTSRVRVGTLRLLEASLDGTVRPEAMRAHMGRVVRSAKEPLRLLDGLRKATLQ